MELAGTVEIIKMGITLSAGLMLGLAALTVTLLQRL